MALWEVANYYTSARASVGSSREFGQEWSRPCLARLFAGRPMSSSSMRNPLPDGSPPRMFQELTTMLELTLSSGMTACNGGLIDRIACSRCRDLAACTLRKVAGGQRSPPPRRSCPLVDLPITNRSTPFLSSFLSGINLGQRKLWEDSLNGGSNRPKG